MKVISLIPGSAEWLKSRSASKAPTVMGDGLYQTRNELIHQMATGITKDVDAGTQARFDNGHRTEAMSRVIAEEIIGDELSPMSTSDDDGYLTANYDGITFDARIGYEHKDWNEKLAACVRDGMVPDSHAWQLDQQIIVGGLDYVLFVVSNGTKEKFASIEYRTTKERTDALLAGWRQFDIDLEEYKRKLEAGEIEQPKAAPKAEAIKALPSVFVQAAGMVTASNLEEFAEAASSFIAAIKTELVSDQDFADAESTVKFCKEAEANLEATKAGVLAQMTTVDEVTRTLDYIAAQLRDKRLMLDKLVKSEKEARKLAIVSGAQGKFDAHLLELEAEIKPVGLNRANASSLKMSIPEAIKGKKSLSSMQDAADTALANAKIAIDTEAADIRKKLAWCKESSAGFGFLFSDLSSLIANNGMEAFQAIVSGRIAKHKADEAEKVEAERAKMEAAAKEKAEREAAAKMAEEEARIRKEEQDKARAEAVALDNREQLAAQERAKNTTQSEAVTHDGARPAAVAQMEPAAPFRSDALEAERYRWLRDRMLGADFDWNGSGVTVLAFEFPRNVGIGGDCDKNIDAAMRATAMKAAA